MREPLYIYTFRVPLTYLILYLLRLYSCFGPKSEGSKTFSKHNTASQSGGQNRRSAADDEFRSRMQIEQKVQERK